MTTIRLIVATAVVALTLGGCSSSDGVPADQVITPRTPPAGWTSSDLGPVKVSAPRSWTKAAAAAISSTVTTTTWRASPSGRSSSGMEVTVISRPQQNARKAATAIAINAMAVLDGGHITPERIAWPHAARAYYFDYTATSGSPAVAYATRTVVLDLSDGSQVQVTALAAKGSSESQAPKRALESVALEETKD